MIRALITGSLILASVIAFGQNTGLYGKRFIVELSSTGSIPVFNLGMRQYKAKNNRLYYKSDYFDYGVRGSFSYALLNNFGFGFEAGIDFSSIPAPTGLEIDTNNDDYSDYFIDMEHERLKIRTISFIPKFEFTTRNGLLPIGLNHQIGFGFTKTRVLKDDYVYESYDEIPITTLSDDLFDYDNAAGVKSFQILYALNVRTPINKRILISYGMRYTANITMRGTMNSYFGYGTNNTKPYYDYDWAYDLIARKRVRSFISLHLGIAVALF